MKIWEKIVKKKKKKVHFLPKFWKKLKQIKTIVNSKGLICLSFVQAFIFDYLIDLQFIIKQTAYLIAKMGDNNISFGSDFYGTKKLPIDLTRYENLKKLRFCMIKEGISQESVDKIFYKNFLNFKNKNFFGKLFVIIAIILIIFSGGKYEINRNRSQNR